MSELEILLENYWISKDKNKELYYKIKDSIPRFKNFITDKLGYHLVVNPFLIKLEKFPGKAESWMGIKDFGSVMEYAFLCIIIMFLEDKGREEQFVLSEVTEYIQANYTGDEKVDWTLYRHRRYLIKVLKFVSSMDMIRVDDGEEQKFTSNMEAEVLYESTGLSRYFVRNFPMNILKYDNYRDIEKEEWTDIGTDKGFIRRQRVYRRLVMGPVVYNEGAEDVDYNYIKNYRSMLSNDLEKYLDYDIHVHRNGAMVVLNPEKNLKDTFPGNKAISDVVLFFNRLIVDEINKNRITLKTDDTAVISRAYFESLVEKLKLNFGMGWSKEYREIRQSELSEEIIHYMHDFNMIDVMEEEKEIKILPLCGKIVGAYPESFNKKL
ncbi:TIGR02678 family protein [Clostridium sp. JNZ X4-2]